MINQINEIHIKFESFNNNFHFKIDKIKLNYT